MSQSLVKVNGTWPTTRAMFGRVDGTYRTAHSAYVKVGGSWVLFFRVSHPLPPAPDMYLENRSDRSILVGISLPGGHRPEIFRIRCLVRVCGPGSVDAFPTGPFDSACYLSQKILAGEDWSEWKYNTNGYIGEFGQIIEGSAFGRSTGVRSDKVYASVIPYAGGTKLQAGTKFNFAAWAQDIYGQWGPVAQGSKQTK